MDSPPAIRPLGAPWECVERLAPGTRMECPQLTPSRSGPGTACQPAGAHGGGAAGARPLLGSEKGGRGRHRIPVPTPGASITREVPQHRPVGPEAQDLLHRQVDHGVVAPLRLHLPRGAPAALSSGAGWRRRLRGSGGGGGCRAPPGRRRRRRGRLRGAGPGAAAAADGPPGGAAQRVSQAAPSPPGRH